jgi:hypothetical protein
MPVIGFLSGRSLVLNSDLVAAFRRALNEAGYVNGQNVAIEFRWADGQLDRSWNWRPTCCSAVRLQGHSPRAQHAAANRP